MRVPQEDMQKKRAMLAAMQNDRLPWWQFWRELSDFYLPRRYVWLHSDTERQRRATAKNSFILDGTGTTAARTLASGMMNGITSPARPWFKLRAVGFDDDLDLDARAWLDEVERRILLVMAESNFYNAMAVTYLDLVVFGTSAMLIYEDFESIIRCYNSPLGEFYLAQSHRRQVNTFAREFVMTVRQVVERFGEENISDSLREKWKLGGARLQDDVHICHLIEPNDRRGKLPKHFAYRELYWEAKCQDPTLVLEETGYRELPGVFPRWELTANDSYGSSPAMDALGDVIQLQHETKKKAQGLDKMISPPMVADIQLQNRPTALLPNGLTFVHGVNNAGLKPAYQINLPLDQLSLDIQQVQSRIREIFHNDLFRMISQLDTVRSATEIDARREEKLVLLGPVLERFENEALDPAINRIYAIMDRASLLPPPPPSLEDADLEIQYVSILTAAQTAVAAIPTERWMQLIGNIAPMYPSAVNVPDWEELIRDYGRDIGVRAKNIKSREEVQEAVERDKAAQALQQTAETGKVMAEGAEALARTEVGGGANALQRIIGG